MLHGPMHYLVYVLFSPELHSYFYVQLPGSAAVVDVHTVFICLVMKGDILEGAEKHKVNSTSSRAGCAAPAIRYLF